MKAIALLVLLVAAPLCAEDLVVLSIDGEVSWGNGINGRAVGFQLDEPVPNATITAHLGNGGGHAKAVAYLMRRIGPGTSRRDEVHERELDLPYPYEGWFPLFKGIDLEAGEYWLVLAKPRDAAFSSINWMMANPMLLKAFPSAHYLGTTSYTFMSDAARFIPASSFGSIDEQQGFQFQLFVPMEPDTTNAQ